MAETLDEDPAPGSLLRPSLLARWFEPDRRRPGYLVARWIVLRALGGIYFSVFWSLAFQIRGLVGPGGILPAREYLDALAREAPGIARFWYAPTLLWLDAGDRALVLLVAAGILFSLLLLANLLPRISIGACALCFLSFVAASRRFSSYQSDGMLLEASFLALFFAPPGLRPGLGAASPPSRASRLLLQFEWFRIYFCSGIVKLASGDPEWRTLRALDHYYQNGPLPTWIGWYAAQLPHAVHALMCALVLFIELGFVWLAWLPRRARLVCFLVVTPMQGIIILTANYAFLNYFVLALGFLLVDDAAFARAGLRPRIAQGTDRGAASDPTAEVDAPARGGRRWLAVVQAIALCTVLYVTVLESSLGLARALPAPLRAPAELLEPLRIANSYGLFAVMTEPRYELEFQGSRDGRAWTPYPFRYKPQDLAAAPGIFAPYQPRFEWNLWFASLGAWRRDAWVVRAEKLLLEGSHSVVSLFQADPFAGAPPSRIRVVKWEYRFTDWKTRRATGRWWEREWRGLYAPTLERTPAGAIDVVELPEGEGGADGADENDDDSGDE